MTTDRNAMQTRTHAHAVDIPSKTTRVQLKEDVQGWLPQLGQLCPPGFEPDRLIAGLLNAVMVTPKLADCDPATIFLALARCARLRLDIGETGMWLVPLKNKHTGRLHCEAWLDYRGLKLTLMRQGLVRSMTEFVVFTGDDFDMEEGMTPKLYHKPVLDPTKRGKLIGAYSRIERPRMIASCHWLGILEIEKRRKSSREWGPDKHPVCPDWWAKKAAVRDFAGRQPKSPELIMALAFDQDAETDVLELAQADPMMQRAAEMAGALRGGADPEGPSEPVDADGVLLDQFGNPLKAPDEDPTETTAADPSTEAPKASLLRLMTSPLWTNSEREQVAARLDAGISDDEARAHLGRAIEELARREAKRAAGGTGNG